MKILTRCTNMIPAERCAVVIFGSAIERENAIHQETRSVTPPGTFGAVDYLEAHGVDEVECGWSGNLTVTGYETATTFHAEGECPRCGQLVVVRGTD